jgi:hypothetical protein
METEIEKKNKMKFNKFLQTVVLYEGVMFNKTVKINLVNGSEILLNPLGFGYLKNKLYVEGIYSKKQVVLDFDLVQDVTLGNENKEWLSVPIEIDEPIYYRPPHCPTKK